MYGIEDEYLTRAEFWRCFWTGVAYAAAACAVVWALTVGVMLAWGAP